MADNGVVALTDARWFEFLRSIAADGHVDEVNFWRPIAQTEFHSLDVGEPFFFRLKHPVNAIAGYGFFAHSARLPLPLAWDVFGVRNGDPSFESFVRRIGEYRKESPEQALQGGRQLTCLILRDAIFFPEDHWHNWGRREEWQRHIMTFKKYDLRTSPGLLLRQLLSAPEPADLTAQYELVDIDGRARALKTMVVREGQGAFRVRVLDAYGRRCSMTGERSLPVVEAAHIQPYLGPSSNHVQNGLALRADVHRLFDAGYITVTPEYRVEVSGRLREEFDNGGIYYERHGKPLVVTPSKETLRPNRQALDWHATNVFR